MERVKHRGKEITVTIDGKVCKGTFGQTILEIARENGIYIPTMCYLTKVNPITTCRMCVVEVEGVDGFILSCNEKAVDNAVVTTKSEALFKERQNIVKMYDVNHPLQCGVCDKSGECDLQNKTLEFQVDSQEFSAVEQKRKNKNWKLLSYDPYLCIMCEKCVHTCNEVVGTQALYIKPGGYNSVIDLKLSKCIQCGECISVCPVGALVSSGFKYSANVWENTSIPSSCSHCSSGCSLYYDVKHSGIHKKGKKITRVRNDFEFASLCGAGRFGFDYANEKVSLDKEKAVSAFKKADAIRFSSLITNEEAYILNQIAKKYNLKLYNQEAKNYQDVLKAYSSITGKSLYSADLETIKKADFIISIGSKLTFDNPMVKFAINKAIKHNRAYFAYMHPVVDESIKQLYSQFIKYEVSTEEGVSALLCSYFIDNSDVKDYLDDLDIGYLSAESNVGEEEIEDLYKKSFRKKEKILIIGEDIITHLRRENIVKLLSLLEKYAGFKILIIPNRTNTLGVSLISNLDEDTNSGFVIGYKEKGDFILNDKDEDGIEVDFYIPALNQQEGTFVNIDKRLVPINVAIEYKGYCLYDIAKDLDVIDSLKYPYTISFTKVLPKDKGFKGIDFDELGFGYLNTSEEIRGYILDTKDVDINISLDDIEELNTFDGLVIYRCETLNQFNTNTYKSPLIKEEAFLVGSNSFAKIAKISSGDKVIIKINNIELEKVFKIDTSMQGNIAFFNSFDKELSKDLVNYDYRYKQVTIKRVD